LLFYFGFVPPRLSGVLDCLLNHFTSRLIRVIWYHFLQTCLDGLTLFISQQPELCDLEVPLAKHQSQLSLCLYPSLIFRHLCKDNIFTRGIIDIRKFIKIHCTSSLLVGSVSCISSTLTSLYYIYFTPLSTPISFHSCLEGFYAAFCDSQFSIKLAIAIQHIAQP